MPKLLNRPPKYSLHKPSGQAKVRYNGKTIYLGKHGTQASLEAYAALVAKLPKPDEPIVFADPLPGTVLMVGECCQRFEAHARTYYARDGIPTGEHVTIRCSLRPLAKRFDALPVTEFGPKKLKQVREDMVALGWTRYYVNKATSIIKRCFTWCASEELVPSSVAVALTTVKGLQKNRTAAREKPPIGPVDDEFVDATLLYVSDLVADVVRTMRVTGMRPGEAVAMTAAEIDRTDSTCWIYRPGHHKTEHKDKTRVIFIGARAQQILLPYILKATDGPLFPIRRAALRRAIQRGCDRLYPHPTIRKPTKRELKKMDEQTKEALLAELHAWQRAHLWHPNQLRHTAATEFRSRDTGQLVSVLFIADNGTIGVSLCCR